MFAITITTRKPAEWGGGTYEYRCTCGEVRVCAGKAFTEVEAQRHLRWHERSGR